jgi:hypothetical protein
MLSALIGGLGVGLVGGLVVGLVVGLFNCGPNLSSMAPWSALVGGLDVGLVLGLFGGLFGGLGVGLDKGGAFVVQHFVLRFLLWKYNHAPLDYVRFLDSAKDLIFLRRLGGGYIFIHRLLLEYFAALSEDDIQRLSAEKANE